MRYLDTGTGDEASCLGRWLTDNVRTDIRAFRCQVGYYTYRALYLFEDILREAASSGRHVHLVLGSNHASLIQSHLEWTLEILRSGENTSLTIIAYQNAEFHPKTVHIERADGSSTALVGSANLTENGLGRNVEAAISIDTADGDDSGIAQQIAEAIDRWRAVDGDGVFHIENNDDILDLKEARLIDEPQPSWPAGGGTGGREDTRLQPGVRERLWHPARRVPASPQRQLGSGASSPPATPAAPLASAIVAPLPDLRWCKELRSSDAQWVKPGTNPTGKLRLSQAHQAIDHRRFFRYQLFGTLQWRVEHHQMKPYEAVEVPFDVTIRDRQLGQRTLTVDHAWHREADQNNVPTVLAWGSEINGILSAQSHVGDWVVIERDASGGYTLRIQENRPEWAP